MRNRLNSILFSVVILLLVVLAIAILFLNVKSSSGKQSLHSPKQAILKKQERNKGKDFHLPNVSPSNWDLILVNRQHITPELNPTLAKVGTITVDYRIAQNVTDFLAAAQKIDPNFHLISGYRSVAYQKGLFQSYVEQEKAANPSLTDEEAQKLVKTYSQPAGASEHQTGLAIDMSTVDLLNQADKEAMRKVHEMAPEFGFVLRFQEGKKQYTGVGYEDWHFRYVGKASAQYMTKHHLTLEQYIKLLEDRNS